MMVAKSFVVVNELVEYENDVQSAAAGREKRRGGRGSAAAAARSLLRAASQKKNGRFKNLGEMGFSFCWTPQDSNVTLIPTYEFLLT